MSAVMALVGNTAPYKLQTTKYHQLNDLSVHFS